MTNALVLTGREEKYAHIFTSDSMEYKHQQVPTDDEQFAAENEASRKLFADIFGLSEDTPQDQIMSFLQGHKDEVLEANKDKDIPIPEEELTVMSDEQREKEYIESQNVFRRREVEEAEEKGLTTPSFSKSTDDVVGSASREDLWNRSQEELYNQQQQRKWDNKPTGARTEPHVTRDTTSGTTPTGRQPRKAIDGFQDMNASIQRLGTQRSSVWRASKVESDEEYFAQFAKSVPWWKRQVRKGRNFMRSNKGRITAKMGIVLMLQMCMAVYGKKYEFEGKQQMFGMFTLMLASFYMTKELSEDGFDVSGLIF